ncbi:MAG: YvcK family protein, partial [Chloroflexi bacterium]|nr:YvcK family protein [Chloroflexota bacterium]
PFLSVAPILAIPGVRERIRELPVPKLAVSPIVAGRAIKGPAAKLIEELTGEPPSCVAVARQYRDLCTHILIDRSDEAAKGEVAALGLKVETAQTVMASENDKVELARSVIALAGLAG